MELEPRCIPARLLIVDDSPTNLRFLAHVLHNMGEIFFATDGPSALKIARDKQPDLILLDVEMPGLFFPLIVGAIPHPVEIIMREYHTRRK